MIKKLLLSLIAFSLIFSIGNARLNNPSIAGQIWQDDGLNILPLEDRNLLIAQNKYLGVLGDTQEYRLFGRLNNLGLQSQLSGQPFNFELYSKDGDRSDNVRLDLYGYGNAQAISNYERLRMGWFGSYYEIAVQKGGDGLSKALRISTPTNAHAWFVNINSRQGFNTFTPNRDFSFYSPNGLGMELTGAASNFYSRITNFTIGGTVRLQMNHQGGNFDWQLIAANTYYAIRDNQAGTEPFYIEKNAPNNSIRIKDTGNIAINNSIANSNLEVNGSFGANVTVITTDETIDATYYTIVFDTTTQNITATLPDPSTCAKRIYNFVNTGISGYDGIISTSAGLIGCGINQTIWNLADLQSAIIQSDGTKYLVLSLGG